MKKIFYLTFILIFSAAPLRAEYWSPFKQDRFKDRHLFRAAAKNAVSNDYPFYVSYIILYTPEVKLNKLPAVQPAMDAWFNNVLSYRNSYPDFDIVFKDILPVLEKSIKLEHIDTLPLHAKGKDEIREKIASMAQETHVAFFFTSKRALLPCSAKALGCFFNDRSAETIAVLLPDFLTKAASMNSLSNEKILIHEIGHLLGLGDLYKKARNNADLEYGSGVQKSIMNRNKLTCDDADGLIGVIDKVLENKRAFESLCRNGIYYINNKKVTREEYAAHTQKHKKNQLIKALDAEFHNRQNRPLK